MRVLFDIVHPAHAHFYRHLHAHLLDEGHECLVLARDKEVTLALLDEFGIRYETHGRPQQGRLRQASELARRDLRLYRMGRKFRPDFVLARNPAGVQAARALGAVGIFDTDDGAAGGVVARLGVPAASVVTTPECLEEDYGEKHIRYPGYKPMAFLHPDHFTPDPGVRTLLGVGDGQFAIIRLTAMDSAHDHNQQGVPREVVDALIERLEPGVQVFLSSEAPVPADLQHRAFPIAPHHMLDAMGSATIVIGDSGSMVGEAAMLGTPAVFSGSFAHRRVYLGDLERSWGLARVFLPDESSEMLETVSAIVDDPATPTIWRERRARMLEHVVDVSSWYYDLLVGIHDDGVAATAATLRARFEPS